MAKETTELSVQQQAALLANPAYTMMKNFELQQRMAQMYVQSTIVPASFRGNIGNCVIAIDMAQRMGANILMVMQNLFVVNGSPSWSAKFLIACINSSGRFSPLRYQFYGKRGTDQYGCRAYAYEKGDKDHKEAICGTWVTMEMAKNEGWIAKNGSKWKSMPDQMLIYRAAAFWQRAYAPEISMGFLTREEVEDGVVIDELPNTITVPATDNEPEPEIDNLPDNGTEGDAPDPDNDAERTNKTSRRAPEGQNATAPAPKPADKVAEAISNQGKGSTKTAKELHEEYMRQKSQQESETPANVDVETGEITNTNVNQQ